MTEGELQKKIKDLFGEWWNEQVFKNQDYEKGEIVSLGQLFQEIVEDAKKEFPKFEQIYLPTKDGKVDWEKTAKIMEQRTIEREKWFKKWFGESSR